MTMDPVVQPRARRPRPKVVTLTDRAAERVREIMDRAEKPYAGLRVGVKNEAAPARNTSWNTRKPPTRWTRWSKTRVSRS